MICQIHWNRGADERGRSDRGIVSFVALLLLYGEVIGKRL
jgi:hypothetical protein